MSCDYDTWALCSPSCISSAVYEITNDALSYVNKYKTNDSGYDDLNTDSDVVVGHEEPFAVTRRKRATD